MSLAPSEVAALSLPDFLSLAAARRKAEALARGGLDDEDRAEILAMLERARHG